MNVTDQKSPVSSAPRTNYGNVPLEVSQSDSSTAAGNNERSDKFQQGGKKFGKKLGNAGMISTRSFLGFMVTKCDTAIFGAGATVGSNIVNSIF